MATPSNKINWTIFKNSYNNFKVLTTRKEIIDMLTKFKDNGNQAIVVGTLKEQDDKMPSWFSYWYKNIYKKDIEALNSRLDNIVKLNNLKEH